MPKVSDEHRAARREQILNAATERFTENGFQATGMADVIAASGLSAGAVYRYFESKDDLIAAIVERVFTGFAARFDAALAADPALSPVAAVRLAVETIEGHATDGPVDYTRLAVQVWAEAVRSDRIGEIAYDTYRGLRAYFVEVSRRAQRNGAVTADADPEMLGAGLFSLCLGYLLQRQLVGDVQPPAYTYAVEALLSDPPS